MGVIFCCGDKSIHMSYGRFAQLRIELAKMISPTFGADYERFLQPYGGGVTESYSRSSVFLPKKILNFFLRSDCDGYCPFTVSQYFYNLLSISSATGIAGIPVADLMEIFKISYTTKQEVWWH